MDKRYLDSLIHLLKIKSISTQKECLPEMEKTRQFLVDLFDSMGFKTKVLKAKKHDAVFAERLQDKKLPTVLVYGHYDVQPPEPLNEWKTSPFDPTIQNGKIWGRGTTDNKGQFMVHVMAVRRLLEKSSKLQINFKFIIEGEEEIGSISVESLVKRYAKNLFSCNYLVVSDSEMYKEGQPSIDVSLRGLVYTEIFLETAKHDVHSGQFGGIAPNPANILARLISELKDENGKILIPRFYDEVEKPTEQELKDFASLKTTQMQLLKEGELLSMDRGEEEFSLNERRWTRPTLDVNGITSGYQGEGSKTIIPSRASAKISMRLVPNQVPEKIYNLFVAHVKSLVPRGVKLTIVKHAGALPYKAPTHHPSFALLRQSLKKSFGKEPVFTGVGGSIGFVPIVANTLKVPCILVGFGLPDENLHAPNEHFSLDNYFKGIEAMSDFYQKLPFLR